MAKGKAKEGKEPLSVAAAPSVNHGTRKAAAISVDKAALAVVQVNQSTGKQPPRITKRELKKLSNDEDGTEGGKANLNDATMRSPEQIKTSNSDAASAVESKSTTPATPRSLHEDFINLMKAQGLEKMATDAGLLKDGQFRDLKREWDTMNQVFLPLKGSDGASATTSSFPTPLSKKKVRSRGAVTAAEKGSKGLRHFSMKVCQKVEEKHITTYNEVADELVHEFVTMRPTDSVYDEKNIRRRVYDALNVLMAMDIISKEKKEIRWRGLPSNTKQDFELLTMEKSQKLKSINQKKQQLQELLLQQIALKNLIRRNQEDNKSTTNTNQATMSRIFLPFIIVNTSKDTIIQCEMSEDRQDIFFNFSGPFEINDDSEILKRMELHRVPPEQVKEHVPEKLLRYLPTDYIKS